MTTISVSTDALITVKEFIKMVKSIPNKRFELLDGVMIAMAGAKPTHGVIVNNISTLVSMYLKQNGYPCRCFSEMECKIDEYNCPQPDISVVCNDSIYGKLLENPTVVGEVLSTNRRNDVQKLSRYQKCSSIQEILMIEQKKMEVTVYQRQGSDWVSAVYRENDIVTLHSIKFSFLVNELYDDVRFSHQ